MASYPLTCLALRNGEWFVCHWGRPIKGVNLEVQGTPTKDRDSYRLSPSENRWFINLQSPDGVTFCPEVRWRGRLVSINGWVRHSNLPLLSCHMDQADLLGSEDARRFEDLVIWIRDQGWTWNFRGEDGIAEIHIGDLEKIPGPPPPGAFS